MAAEGDPNDPKNKKKAPAKPKDDSGGSFMGNFFGGAQTAQAPGTLKAVPASLKPSPTLTEKEQREVSVTPHLPPTECMLQVDILKTLMQSYFTIVKKTIADSVPKTIMHFLVHNARSKIQVQFRSDLSYIIYTKNRITLEYCSS